MTTFLLCLIEVSVLAIGVLLFLIWRNIVSELSDAVARITTSTQNEIAAVIARLNQPDPDVAGAVTALNALSDTLDAETAALQPQPTP